MTIQEMLDKRMTLITEQRSMLDAAEADGRDLSAEEQEKYDRIAVEVDSLQAQVERRRKLEQAEAWASESQGRRTDPEQPENAAANQPENTDEDTMRAFRSYLLGGRSALGEVELRALQADNATQAGYLIAPEVFVASLIQAVDNAVFFRQLATKHTLKYGQNLGIPSLDTDIADAAWTPEIASITFDTALAFGKRSLSTNQLAKGIKVSAPMLRSAAVGVENIVRERLTYKFAATQENVFLNGTGAAQPLGVFTASDDGIGTAYDISTGNTTTSITFDGLKRAKYDLASQYWAKASWLFPKEAVEQVDKLKDGEGQYIWQPSVVVGAPDRLLGFPFRISAYAPNTFETTEYVGILGDFSFYHIADSLAMEIKRIEELYSETNEVGFHARSEMDGMPVLGEAFRRVQLA